MFLGPPLLGLSLIVLFVSFINYSLQIQFKFLELTKFAVIGLIFVMLIAPIVSILIGLGLLKLIQTQVFISLSETVSPIYWLLNIIGFVGFARYTQPRRLTKEKALKLLTLCLILFMFSILLNFYYASFFRTGPDIINLPEPN